MSSGDYRKSSSREDPRLARRESTSIYDDLDGKKKESPRSGSRDPRIREDTAWRGHEGYNQQMQTAYQHLPPSIYSDPSQYSAQGYQGGYPAYQQNYASTYNHYQGYGQTGYAQPSVPGAEYPQGAWGPVGGYVQQGQVTATPTVNSVSDHSEGKKDAVAQEIKHQKTQLIKQREEYVRKIKVLRRELEALKKQARELLSEKSPERDTEHILAENNKLQGEIRTKLKALSDVVEMLSSLIRDNQSLDDLEKQFGLDSPSRSREKSRKSASTDRFDESKKYNYVHYDPELHWCRTCDVFPKTAKDLLLHLQSEEHRKVSQERGMRDDTPWHHLPSEPELPYYEGAPKKRLPIKGLQFFIPAPAWYCKLCDTWIGDLHCASQHLKSQTHSQNYSNFVEQNPQWEIEWLKDREKAVARTKHVSSDSEDISERKRKKHKDRHGENSSRDKKKKKRSKKRRKQSSDSSSSSSSSSDSSSDDEEDASDKTKSIRVAMRNVKVQQIMNEDLGSKWEMLGRLVEERKNKDMMETNKENTQEDRLINQWMTVSEPKDNDKQLLDSLKDRMKQKQEAERVRLAELERKQKEQEKKDKEEAERKEREEREAKEREEQLRKERERQELERIRDKERERVKLKTKEKYRKREDSENGKEHDKRSPSLERKRSRRSPDRRRENGRSSREERRKSSSESPRDRDDHKKDKKPPPPPSYKKFPFIGRMPLFKNKKPEERTEKEIKKEDYDIPRQTRFEPGNLPRAFIPEPEVVCFPKLSSIPPIIMPVQPPEPPKISESKPPKAPPPPKIGENPKDSKEESKQKEKEEEEKLKKKEEQDNADYNNYQMMVDSNPMAQYYDYTMLYQPPVFDYQDIPTDQVPPEISGDVPPLQPPPLPPDDPNDDLAMLGISADDMAAQMF